MDKMEEKFGKLTKEGLLNRDIIETVIAVPDAEIKERLLAKLEIRAKELKVFQNFKRLYKNIQTEIIRSTKQVNNYETEFTNAPIKLMCKNYICDDMGVVKSEFNSNLMMMVDTIVCTHPILPVERLININTNIEKVKLAFYKDYKWQNIIVEKNTLASKNKIINLANTGIEVNENNAKELITYISDLLSINAETIPCNKAVTHLGWVENDFIPYVCNYKFDGDRSFNSVFKDIKSKGDYEIWLQLIKKLRNNKVVHFLIASSFASVLIEILNINPFMVHLWGRSATGKSVTLIVAMSIWGNPKIGHMVKNLNSTDVGLERLSAFLNNIPFAGDELQAIKSKYSDFNELIYKLTQGEGRARGTIDGGVEELLKWHCAFLTTGEDPITSEYSKEGVKNRVIEIEENNSLITNGQEVVSILIENYGFAGKLFIDNLPSKEELNKRFNKIFNQLQEKYDGTGKQINAVSSIILADEIACEFIFNDSPLKVEEMDRFFAKDYKESTRIYDLIIDWLFQNINKFENYTTMENWGKYTYIENGNEKEICNFFVNQTVLKDFLKTKQISFDGVKSKLFDEGVLEKNSSGRFVHQTTINGIKQNAIKIICKKDNDNDDLFII